MIEHVMGDWTNIAFGSIYYALGKLTKQGLIEKVGTEQEGARPSRTIYQITDAGRGEFMRLLREVWAEVEQPTFSFDIGISFMGALPIEDVKIYLHKRVTHLETILQYLDAHQAEELAEEHVPGRLASIVFDHHRAHLIAELDWTRDLAQNVVQGAYDDELSQMQRLFEQSEEDSP